MSNPISRRGFLRQLNCAAIGSSAILNTLLNLKLANSVAAQQGPLDSKALVCIFLGGGMDSFNVLVPWEQSAYNAYSTSFFVRCAKRICRAWGWRVPGTAAPIFVLRIWPINRR